MLHYEDNPGLYVVEGEDVDTALAEARSTSPDDFRHEQQEWAEDNVGLFASHVRESFAIAINGVGEQTAYGTMAGHLLAVAVTRRLVETDRADTSQLAANVISHHDGTIMDLDPYTEDKLRQDFQPDAAESMLQVRDDGARTVAARGLRMLLTTRTSRPG